MPTLEELKARFTIPGFADFIAGNGNLPAVQVRTRQGDTGTVYLHGAHVAAWAPAGKEEVLWLSAKSHWEDGKPIRGGVPLCFPWFGPNKENPQLPAHGIARLRQWTLENIEESSGGVTVVLALTSDAATKAAWPFSFTLRHRVTFGKQLRMALELTNTGSVPLMAEEAQHTYFSVADVRNVRVKGLADTRYIDKTDGMKIKPQPGDIAITAETDRVYLDTSGPVTLEDPGKNRRITVTKTNSHATVVWNPWIAKAKAMPDFGDDEWPTMICLETCNVGAATLTLPPGQTHTMVTRVEVS